MDLTVIATHLPDHITAKLPPAVATLEDGVAAGLVRNQDFTKAKQVINWSVEVAAKAFLESGPGNSGTERGWWSHAYDADALIASFEVHNLPSFLRRARQHGGLVEYVDFIERALLPLHALLQAAKPLIVKRVTGPGAPKTPAQIEREAATMTCQCCGNRYLANSGLIAHHGYRRPGGGWQTPSCSGAQYAPFEVERYELGKLIHRLKAWAAGAVADRKAVADETKPVTIRYTDRAGPRDSLGRRPVISLDVTRVTFDQIKAAHQDAFLLNGMVSFAIEKADDLAGRDREIAGVRAEIKEQQARYDGWKQTHRWAAGKWEPLPMSLHEHNSAA